ncbi:MAG TPA: helix-turn-helix transcriptional regulator [Phenylobacterium sp.]|nr:helix-turn-helix transcriptional regulator [Phenylobacterium sp.]
MTSTIARRHPVDAHVGLRMRRRRRELGITQMQLAETLGVSFQQVQKYEKGLNRVSASRLFSLACALKVPVDYFFEEMERRAAKPPSPLTTGGGEAGDQA